MKIINEPNTPILWVFWALFGNEDDGPIGDVSWNPTRADTLRIRIAWWLRNPLHNFTFYVIGVAHRDFTRSGKHPTEVFAPGGGWNWAVTHCGMARLPFVSYSGRFVRWYIGWRDRGNFGLKLVRA